MHWSCCVRPAGYTRCVLQRMFGEYKERKLHRGDLNDEKRPEHFYFIRVTVNSYHSWFHLYSSQHFSKHQFFHCYRDTKSQHKHASQQAETVEHLELMEREERRNRADTAGGRWEQVEDIAVRILPGEKMVKAKQSEGTTTATRLPNKWTDCQVTHAGWICLWNTPHGNNYSRLHPIA